MTERPSATLVAREETAQGLFVLRLKVEDGQLTQAHQHPGQYVRLAIETLGASLFALTSVPSDSSRVFEFLVRPGSLLADALIEIPLGASVRIEGPFGEGFPLHLAEDKNVVLFATGTGIGAIRPVIELICRDRSRYREVTLFYGVRTPGSIAYQEMLPLWTSAGIRTVLTVSQPGTSGWQGLVGYVQDHLAEVKIERGIAFLSGQDQMISEVKAQLLQRGMNLRDIHLNF